MLTGHPVDPASLWPDIRSELGEDARANAVFTLITCLPTRWRRRGCALWTPSARCAPAAAWERCCSSTRPGSCPGVPTGTSWLACPSASVGHAGPVSSCARPSGSNEDERDRDARACSVSSGWPRSSSMPRAVSGLPTVLDHHRSDLAVVRFHGRADSTWNARNVTAAERFRYLYSEAELVEWAGRARRLAEMASRVHLLMNNCYQDYGVRNAAELASILSEEAEDSE